MNTFQLSCFLAVAEYLNFAKAAQELHVTSPAVSQQIQSLEKELNVTLFQRTTRSVKLTEEGKAFLRDAQQIVAISERAKKRFDSASSRDVELLSLGCSHIPCMFLLSHSLERLREKRPGIHPRLQLIPFQHIYRGLEEGDLDAIAGFKETVAPGTAVYREIAKAPIMCVCSSRHPLSEKREAALEDLKNEPLVLFLPPRSSLTIARLQGQLMGDRPPSEFYFCESAEMISLLVAAGYGISILPDLLIPENPLIARIPLKGAAPLSFGIYYKSLQGKPALRTFLQCVKECFPQSSNVKKPPSVTSSA